MDFDYTDDQRHLRDVARRFLDAECPPSTARAVLDDDARGFDPGLWRAIAGQGWLGITIPEVAGGIGLGATDLAAIAEEIGAALAPVPFGSTLYLFAEAVLLAGSDAQRDRLLPMVAEGRLIGCAAFGEGPGEFDANALTSRVTDGRLTGEKRPVVDGGIADMAVVAAIENGAPGLYLVELAGVERIRMEAIDGSVDVATLRFAGAGAERLPGADADMIERLIARAAIFYAFEQIGGADRCLATIGEHVKHRQAFGGPVGRFQAVKHKLADLYVANQLARSHAYRGLWAMTHAPDQLIAAAAAARVAASDAYWQASKEAIHLHGAIGFTWEHDAHLFYRRAHHLSLALGSPQWWKDRLFAALAAAA